MAIANCFISTKKILLTTLSLFCINAFAADSSKCHNNNWSKEELLSLKAKKYELEDNQRTQLFFQLQHCLASTDSEIRDGVAFEAYTSWLRANKIAAPDASKLLDTFLTDMESANKDKHGIYLPFVVLVTAELARMDRKAPYLTEEVRARLVSANVDYLSTLTDYRGFEDNIGWRHGVAHSADLMLQLTLNPNVSKTQQQQMLAAIATKVAPENHYYTFGEPKRLAMPVLYAFLGGKHSDEEWQNWLNKITASAPMEDWNQSYKSETGLAKRHNTTSFLRAVYTMIGESKNEKLIAMKGPLLEAIKIVN